MYRTPVNLSPLPGFQDKTDLGLERWIVSQSRNLFSLYGFEEVQPPSLERTKIFDVYNRRGEERPDNNVYFQLLNGGKLEDVMLARTVVMSVARMIASDILRNGMENSLPKKVFYANKCWRNEKLEELSETTLREFTQLGCEGVGFSSPYATAEVIELANQFLYRIGIPETMIQTRINSVKIFDKLCEKEELKLRNKDEIRVPLDKISKYRCMKNPEKTEEYNRRLIRILSGSKLPFSRDFRDSVQSLINLTGNEEVIEQARDELPKYTEDGINELKRLSILLDELGIDYKIDLACVRGALPEYTGMVFQTDVVGNETVAELVGGGEYNRLISDLSFTSEPLPAVGWASGLERVKYTLKNLIERGVVTQNTRELTTMWLNDKPDLVVFSNNPEKAMLNAKRLRDSEIRTYVFFGDEDNARNYASRIDRDFIVLPKDAL